jgi:hypothetical protein
MRRYAILSIILVLVFSFIHCNGDDETSRIISALIGPEGGEITSKDGRLTLTFPPGALTEETSITIRRLNKDELSPEFQENDTETAYELSPDGLEFEQPVAVSNIVDQEPIQDDETISASIALIFNISGDEFELVDRLVTLIDADANVIKVRGEIDHFSEQVVILGGVTVALEGFPSKIPPNTPFSPKATVVNGNSDNVTITKAEFSEVTLLRLKDLTGPNQFEMTQSNADAGPAEPYELNLMYECLLGEEGTVGLGILVYIFVLRGEANLPDKGEFDLVVNDPDAKVPVPESTTPLSPEDLQNILGLDISGPGIVVGVTSTVCSLSEEPGDEPMAPPPPQTPTPIPTPSNPFCGNGVKDQVTEACDGMDLDGKTCQDLGFSGGELKCDQECSFDPSGCTGGAQPCKEGAYNGTGGCGIGMFTLGFFSLGDISLTGFPDNPGPLTFEKTDDPNVFNSVRNDLFIFGEPGHSCVLTCGPVDMITLTCSRPQAQCTEVFTLQGN